MTLCHESDIGIIIVTTIIREDYFHFQKLQARLFRESILKCINRGGLRNTNYFLIFFSVSAIWEVYIFILVLNEVNLINLYHMFKHLSADIKTLMSIFY